VSTVQAEVEEAERFHEFDRHVVTCAVFEVYQKQEASQEEHFKKVGWWSWACRPPVLFANGGYLLAFWLLGYSPLRRPHSSET
jgi:hypothetical protein